MAGILSRRQLIEFSTRLLDGLTSGMGLFTNGSGDRCARNSRSKYGGRERKLLHGLRDLLPGVVNVA